MSFTVRTASEFKELLRAGDHESVTTTDVITCATMGVMDSVTARFSIRLPCETPSGFVDSVTMNGLSIVPDMNRDGILDCMVLGETERDDGYGTGHLYRDLVSGKDVRMSLTMDDTEYSTNITIDDMVKAEMRVIYDASTALRCYVNDRPERRACFFSGPKGLEGDMSQCSIVGCGEIEPLFNHSGRTRLRVGDPVLLNGAVGKVIRASTTDSDDVPFVEVVADMHGMDPRYMGGFSGPRGPIPVISIATSIQVDHEDDNRELYVSDMGVPLPISHRDGLVTRHWSSYGDIWPRSSDIVFDSARCMDCEMCDADTYCPMGAFPSSGPDMDLCLSCGSCISNCRGKAFSGKLGHVSFEGKNVPVSIRLSSRKKAEELCVILKGRIVDGTFGPTTRNGSR